ncbi:TPA: RNA polymerase sigma factor SigZ [Bacillus pseudomycoides]|nr:RNA polymerase sigma factor SigZ [Bacillus pseudomycoides]
MMQTKEKGSYMQRSMEYIWMEFSDRLLYFIQRKVSNTGDAEDILQNVFIKIQKSIGQLKDATKLKSWLFQIANHTIIDYYRRPQTEYNMDYEFNQFVTEDDEENANQDIASCLQDFIVLVPEKYRQVMVMYEFQGLKHKEIAEQLNISVSASKSRLQRGRQKLKALLEGCCRFEIDKYGNIVHYEKKEICCES